MRILLIEPAYRRKSKAMLRGDQHIPDDSLWYPPIGLMKIARYHKTRGDEVYFVAGIPDYETKYHADDHWDIVYVTTTFTFYFQKVVETVAFFKGKCDRIIVGGLLATLMQSELLVETEVQPLPGLLKSSAMLGFEDNVNIDELTPDYSILQNSFYAVNDTFYAYTTRGCRIGCSWCAVPKLEPNYESYIDIKSQILQLRAEYGDFSALKLMDNNILLSERLENIITDLVDLGYGRNSKTISGKARTVDFNQGVDATHLNINTITLLEKINITPLRIAFDRVAEKKTYIKAVELAFRHGFRAISNYMLYNYKDTPRDLYQRIMVNIDLNDKWHDGINGKKGQVYCYPMRYAPIDTKFGEGANKERDFFEKINVEKIDWLNAPMWTPKFSRNIDVMKGVAHGAIPTVTSLARRAIGRTFDEFVTNLYMPEEMLRNRNIYERSVFTGEKERVPGNGEIEEFREFILDLLRKQDSVFYFFHNAVVPNRKATIKEAIKRTKNAEIIRWLNRYLINT